MTWPDDTVRHGCDISFPLYSFLHINYRLPPFPDNLVKNLFNLLTVIANAQPHVSAVHIEFPQKFNND